MRTRIREASSAAALLVALAASAGSAGAQQGTIAARVAAAPADAPVTMSFRARPGVCGDGRSFISLGSSTVSGGAYIDGHEGSRGPCEPGPVRVVLQRRGGELADVRTTVGGTTVPAPAPAVDLGTVEPADAADYLMSLARRESGRVADRAVLPAVLADGAVVWPALLAIARDSTRGRHAPPRSTAAFWLSRFAAAAGAGHPGDIARRGASDDDDDDVRGRAVFALSQLPRDEGIPGLVDVARHHRDEGVRAKALFWLGQSGDPRAYALFEELLAGTR